MKRYYQILEYNKIIKLSVLFYVLLLVLTKKNMFLSLGYLQKQKCDIRSAIDTSIRSEYMTKNEKVTNLRIT